MGPGLLDLLLGGEVAAGALEQIPEDGVQVGVAVGQGEGLGALPAGIGMDDGGTQAVDGAEGELPGQVLPEEGGEPPGHVGGGGDGVGDGEDLPGRDPAAADEAAQPGHQHGGLAAARHRQQQGGSRSGQHRGLLLLAQRQRQGGQKLLLGHGRASSRRLSDSKHHYIGPAGKTQAGQAPADRAAHRLVQIGRLERGGAWSVEERQPEGGRERRTEDVDDLIFREEPASGSSQR